MRERSVKNTDGWLLGLVILYGVASLVHFAHNAEYLNDYPNLPSWLSRSDVYVVWLCISALGALGYLLHRRGREMVGLVLVGAYASLGFDGLLHYTRAPVGAHTAAMNLSIWFEVAAAALLLGAVLMFATKHTLRQRRSTSG
jgi:uncharacterized membrane protein YhdT